MDQEECHHEYCGCLIVRRLFS